MIKLDYICFTNNTGYGSAAKNTLHALLRTESYDIKLTPLNLDTKKQQSGLDDSFYKSLVRKESSLDRVQVFHCIPDMHRRFPRNKISIGVGVYETWKPPAHWIATLNKTTAVMVPSGFNEHEFRDAGITKPIFRIPHCIDMDRYHLKVMPKYRYEKFTFLFLGSWRLRKGYDILLKAWAAEFDDNNRVQLLIKTDKPGAAQEVVRHMKLRSVIVDTNKYYDDEMPSFIQSADCLVSPTLGEGFGLPGLQAMALGVPIIITNHSGCQEYANYDTAILLEPEGTVYEKCLDGIPQFSRKHWITLSVAQVRRALRNIFTSPGAARLKAKSASSYVRSRFSYNVLAANFALMLDKIM